MEENICKLKKRIEIIQRTLKTQLWEDIQTTFKIGKRLIVTLPKKRCTETMKYK